MLYHLFKYFDNVHNLPGAGMFQYISFRAAAAIIIALLIVIVFGRNIINFLRRKQIGEEIRDLGLEGQLQKKGTPTMGGVIILLAILVPVLLFGQLDNVYIQLMLVSTIWLGLIGFLDDYIKVVKKRNLGLKAGQKSLGQLLVAVLYLAAEYIFAPHTTLWIPFAGEFDIGFFYYPVMLFIIIGAVNAVNLTDGIDGLASSVTMVAAMGFLVISSIEGFVQMNLLAAALAGVCLGFLVWNFHPAKVFMGDTGSLALGAAISVLAVATRLIYLLPVMGFMYILSTVSVILQVGSFKLRHKRIFKMAPLHHHFELKGMHETSIVVMYYAWTLAFTVLGLVSLGW